MTIICQQLEKRVGKWQNLEVSLLHSVAIYCESLQLWTNKECENRTSWSWPDWRLS